MSKRTPTVICLDTRGKEPTGTLANEVEKHKSTCSSSEMGGCQMDLRCLIAEIFPQRYLTTREHTVVASSAASLSKDAFDPAREHHGEDNCSRSDIHGSVCRLQSR